MPEADDDASTATPTVTNPTDSSTLTDPSTFTNPIPSAVLIPKSRSTSHLPAIIPPSTSRLTANPTLPPRALPTHIRFAPIPSLHTAPSHDSARRVVSASDSPSRDASLTESPSRVVSASASSSRMFSASDSLSPRDISSPSFERARGERSFDLPRPRSEHHASSTSAFHRIRQHPPSQPPTVPPSPTATGFHLPSRASSMTLHMLSSRSSNGPAPSTAPWGGHHSHDDLTRFPSESLHSFSFAPQSDELLHSRASVLRKSLDLLRDKRHAFRTLPSGIVAGPPPVGSDAEMHEVLELLRRASTNPVLAASTAVAETQNDLPAVGLASLGEPAAMTGPALMDGANVFEQQFGPSEDPFDDVASLPPSRGLKRTYTDTGPLAWHAQLVDALSKPYRATDPSELQSPTALPSFGAKAFPPAAHVSGTHPQTARWNPAAQAIFTTEANAPWTILAANDLACLVFGVTRAEVKHLSMLEVVQVDRRDWLTDKLSPAAPLKVSTSHQSSKPPRFGFRNGITARLLRKPPSREASTQPAPSPIGLPSTHGVRLCGDVVPIRKRNGSTGSASLWVQAKPGALIWVLEEIVEDRAALTVDATGSVEAVAGAVDTIWGLRTPDPPVDVRRFLPRAPLTSSTRKLDAAALAKICHFTAQHIDGYGLPVSITAAAAPGTIAVSSFPHIAGIVVLDAESLLIQAANSVVTAALFGQSRPQGLHITELVPHFRKLLDLLVDDEDVELAEGLVLPEHSFRRARAMLALRDGDRDAAALFLGPAGVLARHRDGSDMHVDVQMRVVRRSADDDLVYALWITYSRHLHAAGRPEDLASPWISRPATPPRQPSPGQALTVVSDDEEAPVTPDTSLTEQIREATADPISDKVSRPKRITDFAILEDMGQGAYGQVKLARYQEPPGNKVVLKYVTKKRILVDTWTRDRRLGTVPLEIHVLDFLRRDGLRHPNIVEMVDFFEDHLNYYIEMVPHGLPGMDLFDYIEMRATLDEAECQHIFRQVVAALHHLHVQARVVHRDIKDENIILDGQNTVKLIDFGSAAYLKNGPFDVFVGTIDYAAPEVLQGKSYRGPEQDVWALGILLYTLIYKENPFYNVDEILDRELRVPWVMSDASIGLIRAMLNRDVASRMTIEEVKAHPWLGSAPS